MCLIASLVGRPWGTVFLRYRPRVPRRQEVSKLNNYFYYFVFISAAGQVLQRGWLGRKGMGDQVAVVLIFSQGTEQVEMGRRGER